MGFVAETLSAAGPELLADLHQLGLRLAVFERLFALLEVVAQTSEGEAVHGAIQEIADVVAVPELTDILPLVDGDVAELLLEEIEQLVPDQRERVYDPASGAQFLSLVEGGNHVVHTENSV